MEEKNKINEVEAKVQGSAVVFTYLVTKDIVETLERKLGYSLDREIKEEVRDLENSGLDIEEIYLGFSSNKANRRINNNRKLTALNLFDFYEWIEMRDFFGIDGRNVGMDSDTRLYIPYWENLPKWASISKEKEREVAELCKDYNGILLGLLKQEEYDVRKIGRMIKYEGGK